jgi:hypothetical protein
VQRFGPGPDGSTLELSFDSHGAITPISSTLSTGASKALSAHISTSLISEQDEAIAQTICFSRNRVVKGVYRYRDTFQVLPVPADAVDTPVMAADHPFLLQFKYVRCPDREVDSMRRTEKTAKLYRILNVACRASLLLRSRYVNFFWSSFCDEKMTSKWLQEDYRYSSFKPGLTDFSDASDIPRIQLYPKDEYYKDSFFPDDLHQVSLPDVIDEYLDKVLGLSSTDSQKFAIASSWFSQLPRLWHESSSSAFVAIVSAIEALIEKKSETCKACHQPVHSVTRRFTQSPRCQSRALQYRRLSSGRSPPTVHRPANTRAAW